MSEQLFDRLTIALFEDLFSEDAPISREDLMGSSVETLESVLGLPRDHIYGSTSTYVKVAQLSALHKKYTGKSRFSSVYTDADRAAAAIDGLRTANQKAKEYNQILRNPLKLDPFTATVLGEAQGFIHEVLRRNDMLDVPLSLLARRLMPGPGASIDANGLDYYSKVGESPFTYYSEALPRLYRELAKSDPNAQNAEIIRFLHYGDKDRRSDSRIETVPKSVKTDRTICIEPSLNMMFQKALGALLEDILRDIGLDISSQPVFNAIMAENGSKSGRWATIDLRSASDSVPIELVRYLLPGNWFNWLMTARTGHTELPSGERLELHMMSTMGNAYTFPLQTLVFASIVHAISILSGHSSPFKERDHRRFWDYGVFGDDIIVPSDVYQITCTTLERVGFTVNTDKSYGRGPFRESCGKDFHNGVLVRPVFVDDLSTVQSRISFLNRIVRWAAQWNFRINRVVSLLLATIPKHLAHPVPPWEPDDAGIHVPEKVANACPVLMAHKAKTTLARSLGVLPSSGEKPFYQGGYIYRKFEVKKHQKPLWLIRKGEEQHCYLNPWALTMAVLGGYVRGRYVLLRPRKVTYKSDVYGYSPSWGAVDDGSRFGGWQVKAVDWEQYTVPLYWGRFTG